MSSCLAREILRVRAICCSRRGDGDLGTPDRPARLGPARSSYTLLPPSSLLTREDRSSFPLARAARKGHPRAGQAAQGEDQRAHGDYAPQPAGQQRNTRISSWALPARGGLTLHCRRRGPTVERRSRARPGALLRGFRYLVAGHGGGAATPRHGLGIRAYSPGTLESLDGLRSSSTKHSNVSKN